LTSNSPSLIGADVAGAFGRSTRCSSGRLVAFRRFLLLGALLFSAVRAVDLYSKKFVYTFAVAVPAKELAHAEEGWGFAGLPSCKRLALVAAISIKLSFNLCGARFQPAPPHQRARPLRIAHSVLPYMCLGSHGFRAACCQFGRVPSTSSRIGEGRMLAGIVGAVAAAGSSRSRSGLCCYRSRCRVKSRCKVIGLYLSLMCMGAAQWLNL